MVIREDFRQKRDLASKDLNYIGPFNRISYDKNIGIFNEELDSLNTLFLEYYPDRSVRKQPGSIPHGSSLLSPGYLEFRYLGPEKSKSEKETMNPQIIAPAESQEKEQNQIHKKGWLMRMYRTSIIGALTGILMGGIFGGFLGATLGGIAGVLIGISFEETGISFEETEKRNEGW